MKQQTVDGITVSKWQKIKQFAAEYTRPVNKLHKIPNILDFYLSPLIEELPTSKPTYKTMQPERMITIAYHVYSTTHNKLEKAKAIEFLKLMISEYRLLF